MIKKQIVTLLLILLSVGMASANVVNVGPDSLAANAGQTVAYQVRTDSISDIEEHVVLSITDPVAGWTYDFDTPAFDLATGDSFTTNLHVSLPASVTPNIYESTVLGTSSIPGFEDFLTGTSFFTFTTAVIKASTSTVVTSSANPSVLEQSVTLTTVVSVIAPGVGTPSGNVEFLDGTISLGMVLSLIHI